MYLVTENINKLFKRHKETKELTEQYMEIDKEGVQRSEGQVV